MSQWHEHKLTKCKLGPVAHISRVTPCSTHTDPATGCLCMFVCVLWKIRDVRVGCVNCCWMSLESFWSGSASHTWARLTAGLEEKADRSSGAESWGVIMRTEPLKQRGVTAVLTAHLTEAVYPCLPSHTTEPPMHSYAKRLKLFNILLGCVSSTCSLIVQLIEQKKRFK